MRDSPILAFIFLFGQAESICKCMRTSRNSIFADTFAKTLQAVSHTPFYARMLLTNCFWTTTLRLKKVLLNSGHANCTS